MMWYIVNELERLFLKVKIRIWGRTAHFQKFYFNSILVFRIFFLFSYQFRFEMVKSNINVFQTFLKLRGVTTFEGQMISPYTRFLNFKPVVSEPLIQKS